MSTDSPVPRRAPSITTMDIVFPGDANTHGTMFGGKVMMMMDKAAVLAAIRFARVPFVTVSSDGIQFLKPIHVGNIIEARARVAYVSRTSLIVKVEVFCQYPYDNEEPVLATKDWFALVARDRSGKGGGIVLPPLLVETDEQRSDYEAARRFREKSLRREVE